jgi:hypothetical protein
MKIWQAIDWNATGQFLIALGTRMKKSQGMKILKNRSVDSMGVGVGLVMAAWWVLQFSGLPKPLQEFVDAGNSLGEVRAALARVELNTQHTNEQLQDLSLDLERYKDNHARTHSHLNRMLKNGYPD